MRYTFKQLEYFVAVAESGTIVGAAEKIHISPPSISVAISQLEESLKVRLFVRQSSGLELTETGNEVLAHARHVLGKAQELQDFGLHPAGELHGKVILGAFTTLAPLVFPEICKSFSKTHPAVTIDLVEGSQDQLIGYLRRGVIDLAVTYEMHIPQDVWFEPLVGLSPRIMLDANHPLAGMATVDIREVREEPYILLDLPISRDYFLSIFEKSGVTPNIRMKTTHFEVIRTMVANGIGVSISVMHPLNSMALDGKEIIFVPISNPLPVLNIGIISRRSDFSQLALVLKKKIQELITPNHIPGMHV